MAATVSRLPIVLSLIAIVLGGGLIAEAVLLQNTINSMNDKVNTLDTRVGTVEAGKIQSLTLIIGEGELTNASTTPETRASVEYHRWEPAVLVVHKGDTVNLTVINPRKHPHSFYMAPSPSSSFPILDSQSLAPRGGTWNQQFVADKTGIYKFICNIDFNAYVLSDPNDDDCDPDHSTIVGYLVVLA